MIMEMARYIGVIDLCATGEAEVVYPFQRQLGIDLRALSESKIQSYSDLKTEIHSLVAQATEEIHILFVLSKSGTQKISAGLGLIGEISKQKNILTIGIFSREVFRMNANAIVLYNSTFLVDSFEDSSWISDATSIILGISDTIVIPGLVGIDLADIKAVLIDAGETLIGTGAGQGADRTIIAAESALRDLSTQSAHFSSASSILVSTFAGIHTNLVELDAAVQIIAAAFKNEPVIMASLIPYSQIQDNFIIKVFAGGFPNHKLRQPSGAVPNGRT